MKATPMAWSLLSLQVIVVLVTTFGVVTVTYETRQQFALLEQTRNEQRVLLEDWGKLLLEESAFSSPSRVERLAREELNMVLPQPADILEMNKEQ